MRELAGDEPAHLVHVDPDAFGQRAEIWSVAQEESSSEKVSGRLDSHGVRAHHPIAQLGRSNVAVPPGLPHRATVSTGNRRRPTKSEPYRGVTARSA
jgi:hypothetical protein